LPTKTDSTTTIVRVLAALILIAFGFRLGAFVRWPIGILGTALVLVGVAALGYIGIHFIKERREQPDRYDLSKLWEDAPPPPEEPEEDDEERNLIFCHRCGTAMPDNHSICRVCGNRLGH
jgi:uncharacterized paraquat-inducible protein A